MYINSSRWMRECNIHPRGLSIFLLEKGGGGGPAPGVWYFLCSFVPNVFWSSSQKVPQDVPHGIAILSPMICPKLCCFHPYKWAKRGALPLPIEISIFGNLQIFRCVGFWCSHHVLNVFSLCSQLVPPRCSHWHLVLFHDLCPKLNSH